MNATKQIQPQKIYAEVCGKITYVNRKNRKLFKIHAEKANKDFRVICSYFCPVSEGDAIYALCEYKDDKRYGETLILVEEPFVILSQDKDSILSCFLKGLRGSGFGNLTAHNLYSRIEENYNTSSVTGVINGLDNLSISYCYKQDDIKDLYVGYAIVLKEKQFIKLLNWWYKNRVLRRLYLLGLYNKEIKNARMDPLEIYKRCLENPFTIYSLSMDKCNNILKRIGKTIGDDIIECAIITRQLKDNMDSRGWVGTPSNIVIRCYPNVKDYLDILTDEFCVKTELHTVYLPYAYEVETGVSEMVSNLVNSDILPKAIDDCDILYSRPDLSPDQKLAITGALKDNISIITGSAGVGKTTIIKEIVTNLERSNISYMVVSFTGKAVARVREVIGKKDPMTMHMMIASKKKIKFKHLIIDEASMVTSQLFYEFLSKFDTDYRITLVGDANQLTPIGWGSLFASLINSRVVPIYKLTKCHRTSDDKDNGILINANRIIEHSDSDYNGPPFEYEITGNFQILPGDISIVGDLVKILRNQGIDSDKIKIISPYNRSLSEINSMCQNIYNNDNRSLKDGNIRSWNINDKVMMIENNYTLDVMNGDEGDIIDLSPDEVMIKFKDGRSHIFRLSDSINEEKSKNEEYLEDYEQQVTTLSIIHSFGVSVHRSQGSEWDYVILYIPEVGSSSFLNRNLIYTALTRAKKCVWCVGDYNTMVRAATTSPSHRYDNLSLRLQNYKQ